MHRAAKQIAILVLVVSVASLFVACDRNTSGSVGGATDSTVAATVNGKKIMLNEVERIISQQAKGQQSQLSPLELAAARLQVLDGLIQQEALLQRAENEKLTPTDEEVTNAINAQKQQNRLTEEEYQKMLQESNQTEQDLRVIARKQIAIQKLQEKVNAKIGLPTDREVEDIYNNNRSSFVKARGVGLAAIVVDPANQGAQDDAKGEAEAKLKADRVYQQLKSGADFATVARASSEDPQSYLRGGDLGTFSEQDLQQAGFPQDLIPKFFNAMQVGDTTPPVRSSNGRYYIFKLTGRQLENENQTLDSPGVRDQIKDALINQRRTLLNEALMRSAMNEAKIVNNLAMSMLNDPASLNSLKPVASGSASPAAASATPAATAATPAAAATKPAATNTPQGAK